MIITKTPRKKHFTKDFGDGTIAHRVILPGRDDCRAKVTKFNPKAGFCPGENVVHKTDELVYVLEGRIRIVSGDQIEILNTGAMYYTPAGTPTTMRALEDSRLLCVFFPVKDGPLPDDL